MFSPIMAALSMPVALQWPAKDTARMTVITYLLVGFVVGLISLSLQHRNAVVVNGFPRLVENELLFGFCDCGGGSL